tara:strand:+ start:144 stop:347 length:204 start_codon:yes stop_codon:yes gene_type:complete
LYTLPSVLRDTCIAPKKSACKKIRKKEKKKRKKEKKQRKKEKKNKKNRVTGTLCATPDQKKECDVRV